MRPDFAIIILHRKIWEIWEMSKFRLHTKGVFFTYPQCPAPREAVRDMVLAHGYDIDKGIVGQETH